MITVICRDCNDWERSSPHGPGLLQALDDHKKNKCTAQLRRFFNAHNKEEETT